MATNHEHTTFKEEIRTHNDKLGQALRSTVGISLSSYKSIKWVVQGIGVVGGIIAMTELGAQPITTLIIMLLMIHGPEALEYFLARGEE